MTFDRPTRRAVLRHLALGGLGAAALPLWAGELIAPRRVLDAVAEAIIPGAKRAGVGEYIDAVLADDPRLRPQFLIGLAEVDRRCRETYGIGFAVAAPDQQAAILSL